jgi:Cu-processing system permease protein
MNVVCTIAGKELSDHFRNGWVLAISAAFAVFALVIGFAGFGFTGELGARDQGATLTSLTSLVIYLIPLLGLLLGYDGIAGEHERGTLDLLLSYPLQPVQLLLGKWLGLVGVLGAALLLGLVAPTALAVAGGQGLGAWLTFAVLSAWLGAIFVGVALLLSTFTRERARLLGIALGLWLLLVILFDLALIGLLVASGGTLPAALVSGLFFANPTSLFRFLNLTLLLDAKALADTGLAAAAPTLWMLVAALAAWTVGPLLAAGFAVRRQ